MLKPRDNILKSVENPETIKENVKIYKELIEKYPHSWSARMAHYHLGNIYYNNGEIDKAIAL